MTDGMTHWHVFNLTTSRRGRQETKVPSRRRSGAAGSGMANAAHLRSENIYLQQFQAVRFKVSQTTNTGLRSQHTSPCMASMGFSCRKGKLGVGRPRGLAQSGGGPQCLEKAGVGSS